HKRYALISALRADAHASRHAEKLGQHAVRRGLKAIDEARGIPWLNAHRDYCTAPLLGEGWVLDADTTIKPLYGHQEPEAARPPGPRLSQLYAGQCAPGARCRGDGGQRAHKQSFRIRIMGAS